MQGQETLWSSKTDQWATPQDFYDMLNAEFHFNLDPCADEFNHKCERYFTKEQDGLSQSWGGVQSFLQSPIRQGYRQMGRKGIHGKPKAQHSCGDADSCKNRHEMVS